MKTKDLSKMAILAEFGLSIFAIVARMVVSN